MALNPGGPRASMIVLAYNQEATVRDAVASCLAQECEPIEIILSDDFSTDSTYTILQEMAAAYRGPHRVWARRSERNLGIGEHYNQLVDAASGELLVTAAGDDLSRPSRVARLLAAWDATGGKVDLIASHVNDLDDDGKLHGVMRVDDLSVYRGVDDWSRKRPYIIGAGHAFTRRMMKRFGPMDAGVFYEDQIMVFRAIASGGAATVDEALVDYRRGGTSRRPIFDSMSHMKRWTTRQYNRSLAEIRQLMKDAQVAGCEALMREHVKMDLAKITYQLAIHASTTSDERWAAYHAASPLSVSWRLRKMAHSVFPHASYLVRRQLGLWHAWRYRAGLSQKQHDQLPPEDAVPGR
jgi:glycosyltransferase involved in cell wall biosynthesis